MRQFKKDCREEFPIQIVELAKSYPSKAGNVQVLDAVSLEVKKGSITGLIGRSGAGKTTLLRCINMLERPDGGKLYIDGIEIVSASPGEIKRVRSDIGFIPQAFNLLSRRTVFGNIRLPLEIAKWSKSEINQRVLELAGVVGLADKLESYPCQLSGGQKQRVAIARALAARPKILLCDEFTSALDPQTTDEILNLIKEITRELGVTVLLITHDMSVVRKVCETVFVLKEGRVVKQGLVSEVFGVRGEEVAL